MNTDTFVSFQQLLLLAVPLWALFAAAVFQPQRIRNAAAYWAAIVLLALALVLPSFSLLSLRLGTPPPTSRGAESVAQLEGSLTEFLQTARLLILLSQLLLAGGLIATAAALFPLPWRTTPALAGRGPETPQQTAERPEPVDITRLPKFPGQ